MSLFFLEIFHIYLSFSIFPFSFYICRHCLWLWASALWSFLAVLFEHELLIICWCPPLFIGKFTRIWNLVLNRSVVFQTSSRTSTFGVPTFAFNSACSHPSPLASTILWRCSLFPPYPLFASLQLWRVYLIYLPFSSSSTADRIRIHEHLTQRLIYWIAYSLLDPPSQGFELSRKQKHPGMAWWSHP